MGATESDAPWEVGLNGIKASSELKMPTGFDIRNRYTFHKKNETKKRTEA